MKKSKCIIRDFIATGCAAALALGGAAPAFANTTMAYDGPKTETPIINADGSRYATSVGQHGSAVVGEYAGLNQQVNEIYATPGNGVSAENYMYNPYIGIFGTDVNEVPDAYTANLFYNWYVEANNMTAGAAQLQKSDNAMINFLFTSSKGSSIVKDESVTESGTSITLSRRPDILTVNDTGLGQFDEQIKTINSQDPSSQYFIAASDTYVGDDKYNPIYVPYLEKNWKTQIQNMWDTAAAAKKVEDDSKAAGLKVYTRYGDSMATAQKYELYVKGSVLYTLSQLDEFGGKVPKRTVAYVKGISGNDRNATVTLYGAPDPNNCREMAHHFECTVATANNLANVLDPTLERKGEPKDAVATCTVEDLAKADVIILADPDNMAYNFNGIDDDGLFVTIKSLGDWTKTESGGPTAENNWGQSASRNFQGKYFKNEFYGVQESTNTMVSNIKAALNDLGTAKATALAKKNILSCVQEGSSSSDGGSIEAVSQWGIVNAFIYPEIASGVNQYAWWLDNIAHVKTDKVPSMVRILAQEMSLADTAKLSDVDSYNAKTSDAIERTYYDGLAFYQKEKSTIDGKYGWLAPTSDLKLTKAEAAAAYPTNKIDTSASTAKAQSQKIKASAKVTIKRGKKKTVKVSGAKTALKVTVPAKAKKAKVTATASGKAGVKIAVGKKAKKGTYKITVQAKKTSKFKASNTVTVSVKVN